MENWEPKPPGTVWATPGLLWESFNFTSDNEMNVAVFKSPRLQEHYIINHTEKKCREGKFKS